MLLLLWTALAGGLNAKADADAPDITRFFATTSLDAAEAGGAFEATTAGWRNSCVAIRWDIARFLLAPRPDATGVLAANMAVRDWIVRYLKERTGQDYG